MGKLIDDGTPLRVLIVEDSEDDTLLILRELRRSGFAPVADRVESPEALRAALEGGQWDAVICDYAMPRLDGLAALAILAATALDLPFLVVSGAIGEEVAVGAMKAGAHDYVMKDNLARLGPAMRRELKEAEVRRAKRRAEAENVELYQETRRQAHRLAALLEIGQDVSATLHLPSVLLRIATHARELLQADDSDVYLLEADGRTLRPIVSLGNYAEETLAMSLELGRGIVGSIAQSGVAELVDHAQNDPRAVQVPGSPPEPYGIMSAPLRYRGQLLGAISVGRLGDRETFRPADLQFLQSLARQAAIAIENARLYGQARRLAALEERQRLARDLHDSVSQVLYGVGLGARTAHAWLAGADIPAELKAGLEEPLDFLLSLVEEGLAEMRVLILELRPDLLERQGLVAALAQQATAARVRHKLDVHTAFCPEPVLPFLVKEALYRIAQESLTNAAMHAQAGRLEIRLAPEDEGIALEVQDDGVGFDPEREHPGRLGLRSMRERAAELGGHLEIVSSPGQGARVRAWVPLDPTPDGPGPGQTRASMPS
jgi:signal transduction histidine kinase